jgi:DNA-binding NtrC family response regulator
MQKSLLAWEIEAIPMTPRTSFPTVPVSQIPAENSLDSGKEHRPVVLVVDDECIIADTLSAILARNGYAVMTAYDGFAALEIARLVPPELLITDVVMPRMSGIDLAMKILETASDCNVILFSGQDVTAALLAPVERAEYRFEVLRKPLHPAVMLEHVAECLKARAVAEYLPAERYAERHRTFRAGRHARIDGQKTSAHAY